MTQSIEDDRKQIQTHLKLTGLILGYLLNFGEALLKDGIVRAANGLEENLCASASLREKNKFQPDSGINSVSAPPPLRDTLLRYLRILIHMSLIELEL